MEGKGAEEGLADQKYVDELYAECCKMEHAKDELGLTRSNREGIKIGVLVVWIFIGLSLFSGVTVAVVAFLAFMYDTFLIKENPDYVQAHKDYSRARFEVLAQQQAKQKAKDYQLNYSSVLLEILAKQKDGNEEGKK